MIVPQVMFAAGIPERIVPKCDGPNCTCDDLILLANRLLNTGIYVAVVLSALLFAWAGWKMMSGNATGNSEAIGEAKKVIWNVIIGLVIILASWLLVSSILGVLGNGNLQSLGKICEIGRAHV